MRVFLDANVLNRGTTSPHLPYELLLHAIRGHFTPVVSPLILLTARYYIRRTFPQDMRHFEVLLATMPLEVVAEPSALEVAQAAGLVRDADDVPIALAAIKAGVDCLVSTDPDLTDQDASTACLRAQLRVMRVGDFLRLEMGRSSAELAAIGKRTWRDIAGPRWA